jgi:glycerophosphoryl diester phosphodiesterase
MMIVHGSAAAGPLGVYFQAHRGGMKEVPENTLIAYRHAWSCPGAIPEVDVCVTKDGAMVCLHDDTPARTTTAPDPWKNKPISELALPQIRQWDAGIKFSRQYAGEKVPLLTEVFEEMTGHPDRQVYLDLKNVDLHKLTALIGQYGLNKQIILVHGDPAMCATLKDLFPGARTMTWLSGSPDEIKRRFQQMSETGFRGLSQLQFHLRPERTEPEIQYVLDAGFLRAAMEKTKAAGVDLQLRPFVFDEKSLQHLCDIGVRWYVTDEPQRFAQTVARVHAPNK